MAIKFLRHGFLRVAGSLALAGMLGASNGAALAQEICPERGGTIKAVDMNYTNMDPTARIDPASYLRLIYDSLIDVTMDLQYRPGLAEELPEQVGDKIESATDKAGDALERAGDKVEEKLEE